MADERHDEIAQVHRLVIRFGNELLQDGFTSVPNLVLTHYAMLGITAAEMMFSIHVWQYWWTEKDPYPALQTIADRMSVTRRQVRNYTQSLKQKGYLVVNERADPNHGQLTSEYDFGPLLDAVLFVRTLLGKLTPLGSRTQQVALARSLGDVFGEEGAEAVGSALDELVEQLRPAAPLMAHALQEERKAIVGLKAPRSVSNGAPRKSVTAAPRKDSSEGGRKNRSEAPRKPVSSEEYIEQADEEPKHTHREKDESATSNSFDRFASTRQTRKPSGFSKAARSVADSRQAAGSPSSGMTAVGQIVARRETPTPEDAPSSPRMAPGAAGKAQGRASGVMDRPTPSTPQNGAHSASDRQTRSGAARGERRPPPPKLPPYLEDVVSRYSRELHDEEHIAQNLGQAGRLWKASGWSESAFGQALTEAKEITLRRDIKKRATVGGEIGARNKMPYYFKVLRDVLGMKESQGEGSSGS